MQVTHHAIPGRAQLLVCEHCKDNLELNIILCDAVRHQSSVKHL